MHKLQEATSQDPTPSAPHRICHIRLAWMFRDDMADIDGVVIKGQHIVILKHYSSR